MKLYALKIGEYIHFKMNLLKISEKLRGDDRSHRPSLSLLPLNTPLFAVTTKKQLALQ